MNEQPYKLPKNAPLWVRNSSIAKQKEWHEEYKAKRKAYEQTPEVKAKLKVYQKAYRQTPEYKAKRRVYDKSKGCLKYRRLYALYYKYPELGEFPQNWHKIDEMHLHSLCAEIRVCRKGLANMSQSEKSSVFRLILSPSEYNIHRSHIEPIVVANRNKIAKIKQKRRYWAKRYNPTAKNIANIEYRKRYRAKWYQNNKERILKKQAKRRKTERDSKNCLSFFQAMNTASEIARNAKTTNQ